MDVRSETETGETLQTLRAQLAAGDPETRLAAARRLAQQGDFTGIPVLLHDLDDTDSDVRVEAVALLGEIGAPAAVPSLCARLHDPEPEVRNEAIFALLAIGVPAAVPCLIQALEDEDRERREDARVALSELAGDVIGNVLNTTGGRKRTAEGAEDRSEATRASGAWKTHAAQFDPALCYANGNPVSLGTWIARLQAAAKPERDDLLRRLLLWTGISLAAKAPSRLAAQWETWWQTHRLSYPPGRRFYYGHSVPQDA